MNEQELRQHRKERENVLRQLDDLIDRCKYGLCSDMDKQHGQYAPTIVQALHQKARILGFYVDEGIL